MDEGDTFPEFELLTHEGQKFTSEDIKGRRFVLFAYPRALTPGCTKEACSVRDHFAELQDKGFMPLGISDDPPAKNKKFVEKHELQYTLLSDEGANLLRSIGAYGEKKMYGKTYEGTMRYSYIVDENGTVKKIFRKVKVAEHANELLDAIEELGM